MPFFLLVGTFPGFSQSSLEKQKQPVAVCRFSKEFCANPRNVSTNRKRGTALCCPQKSFAKSKENSL
jgi:hypothetical protein